MKSVFRLFLWVLLIHVGSVDALGHPFEVAGGQPEVSQHELFSTSAEDAIYHAIKFKAGSVYVSEGNKVGDLLVTKSEIDALWAFIGDSDSFKLLSKKGYYVGVKKVNSDDFCYTVSKEGTAAKFTMITNADGSFEIARKGSISKTFNP